RASGKKRAWARGLSLAQRRGHVLSRQRHRVEIALSEIAAERDQPAFLCRGLHALGDDFHPEAVPEVDHRGRDRLRLGSLAKLADEAAVDLEQVDRELAEVRQ